MANTTTPASGARSSGLGLGTLLGVLFVGLKLGHVITWPWLWVLAPFWIGLALMLSLALIGIIILGIVSLVEERQKIKRRETERLTRRF